MPDLPAFRTVAVPGSVEFTMMALPSGRVIANEPGELTAASATAIRPWL